MFNRKKPRTKIYTKFVASAVSLVVSLVLIVSATYAWLTMSESPAVNGIQITISGGTSILLAPDIVKEENGQVLHYPGLFDSTLNFYGEAAYEQLTLAKGLSPVSSADGLNWYIPVYDESTGMIAEYDAFTRDTTLAYGNNTQQAGYAYFDIWVVSPGSGYDLRVSCDKQNNKGSYFIELPHAVEDETAASGYALEESDSFLSSIVRVGFLANADTQTDNSMLAYQSSMNFDERYSSLKGVYSEGGESYDENAEYAFTIYEPNGDLHSGMDIANGSYVVTRPLSYSEGTTSVYETDIRDQLTVQLTNKFRSASDSLQFEEIFQTALFCKSVGSAKAAEEKFYNEYLEGQVSEYVESGLFVTDTKSLYNAAATGQASPEAMGLLDTSGATESVIISALERNSPQRIRVFVWLEGQDPDCSNIGNVVVSNLSLGLELAGATQ